MILTKTGTGDVRLSSRWQSHLSGNYFEQSTMCTFQNEEFEGASLWELVLGHGSLLTLKNYGWNGGLLHIDAPPKPPPYVPMEAYLNYVHVTGFHSHVPENEWVIIKTRASPDFVMPEEVEIIRDGDVVVIMNREHDCNLRSSKSPAKLSKSYHRVDCEFDRTGNVNEFWRVEVVSNEPQRYADYSQVHTIVTTFRVRNMESGCLLRNHNVVYPDLEYYQTEIVCDIKDSRDSYNIWNVEQTWNPKSKSGVKSAGKILILQMNSARGKRSQFGSQLFHRGAQLEHCHAYAEQCADSQVER